MPVHTSPTPTRTPTTTHEIILQLNHLLADEWLGHFQYWAGAQVCKGPMRKIVADELLEHSREELEHAHLIAKRIVQLGGQVLIHHGDLQQESTCGYRPPTDCSIKAIVKQNMEGELCSMHALKKLIEMTESCDPVTHDLARELLKKETEHYTEMRNFMEDFEHICKTE